jgi:putative endonuclease
MWYVYLIKSQGAKSFTYIGSTDNVDRRLSEHNSGAVQSTKAYVPYKLLAYVAVEEERQARRLEKYFKTGSDKTVLYKRILGLSPTS